MSKVCVWCLALLSVLCYAHCKQLSDSPPLYPNDFRPISADEVKRAAIYRSKVYPAIVDKYYPSHVDSNAHRRLRRAIVASDPLSAPNDKSTEKKDGNGKHNDGTKGENKHDVEKESPSFLDKVKGWLGLGSSEKEMHNASLGKKNKTSSSKGIQVATCRFDGSGQGKVEGTVQLAQKNDELMIHGSIRGLRQDKAGKKIKHGFHVHQEGKLGDKCKDAMGHYNPMKRKHGGPKDDERHVGDLGNIESQGGDAVIKIRDKIALLSGNQSILGRSLVLHEKEDDFGKGGDEESTKTGNAGKRLACCVIKEQQSHSKDTNSKDKLHKGHGKN